MKCITRWIRVLFTPGIWISSDAYSKVLDDEIQLLIKSHSFKKVSEWESMLGNLRLWTKNHPYGSMTCCAIRPSKATVLELYDKYVKEVICQH